MKFHPLYSMAAVAAFTVGVPVSALGAQAHKAGHDTVKVVKDSVKVARDSIKAQADSAPPVERIILPPPAAVPLSMLGSGVDSILASPGQSYQAWALHRMLFGDLQRDIWSVQFKVPVLRLDTLSGGAKVLELSGGKQTLGVRLMGKDSVVYQFRSMVKDPRRAFPSLVRWTPFAMAAKDQMASQFPLAPLVVAELLEAADVLVAKPRAVILGDDPVLGDYRPAFAGRMGWLEVRPEEREGDKPGFAGSTKITDTEALYERIREDPRAYVNAHAMLRARMVDFIVGDWDRHSDQWRWARFEDGERFRWDPIPRDRDWAFARIDGLSASIIPKYYVQFVGFSAEYPDIKHLTWAAQRVDRTLLTSLDRDAFMKVASDVAKTLSDSVLRRSVSVLPPQYAHAGNSLYNSMRARRDGLVNIAGEFYALLAAIPSVYGTKEADSVAIAVDGRNVRVQLHGIGDAKLLRFERTFVDGETNELRLYLNDGNDRVVITGSSLPIPLRIVTGADDDQVTDQTDGNNVYVYNVAGDDDLELGNKAFETERKYLMQDSIRTGKMKWNNRDWGSGAYLMPAADIEPEIGVLLGANLRLYQYGFGQQSCHTCLTVGMLGAIRDNEWIANVGFDQLISAGGLWLTNSAQLHSGMPLRFYGFGNDIEPVDDEDPFTGFRRTLDVFSGLRLEPASSWHFDLGGMYRKSGRVRDGGEIFETDLYGDGEFEQAGVRALLDFDTRDSRQLPTRGAVIRVNADFQPEVLDVEEPFTSARAQLRFYQSFPLPLHPTLHLRAIGEKVWGTAPFAEMPALGGSSSLPGFARRQYRGDALAAGSAMLRAKVFTFKGLQFGAHGVTSTGRVWLDGEESSTWHTASGYGGWLHIGAIGRTLSVTFAEGEKQRMYVNLGFIY